MIFFLFLPWFHEDTTKVDLSVKVDVHHLLQVVLTTTAPTKFIRIYHLHMNHLYNYKQLHKYMYE